MNTLTRLARHLWLDASDARRAVPDDMAERLSQRVAASEGRHLGEVRLCVEASLPLGEVLGGIRHSSIQDVVRGRALGWFGRLGVWDTEENNGVLIYLLLAEHSIEFVADRALSQRVPPEQWKAMVGRLGSHLRAGGFEDGLTQALEEVSAVLTEHFPAEAGHRRRNELPDWVVRA
jgi:uncharacterized membrane protein